MSDSDVSIPQKVAALPEALARDKLRPYAEMPAFREYLKEQILKWETWHRAHIEEINDFEGLRDNLQRELTDLQGDEIRHSDDPAGFDALGHAETCYENYRDIAAGLKDDPEYNLVADREPVLFKEASVATIVALFWCDLNHSTLPVPNYDFMEPEGPFLEILREQWQNPIHDRYRYIHWFVEAAIKAYESRIPDGSVSQSTKTEKPNETDNKLPKAIRKDSPSRVKAKAAYEYAMQQIPNAHAMTAVELFDAIRGDGEAKEMLPPTAETLIKYLNDCGIRLRKSDPKPTSSSVVRRSDT